MSVSTALWNICNLWFLLHSFSGSSDRSSEFIIGFYESRSPILYTFDLIHLILSIGVPNGSRIL